MIAEPTTTEQIYQRADDSIAELEQKSTEIASRISQAQDELTTLTQGREERFQGLQQARALTAQCESQHIQAVQYLKLVAGSPREEQALTGRADSKKRLAEQRKELAKLELTVAEADNQDKPREQELTTTLQELTTEQECIRQEIKGLEQAKEQTFREEGYERYTEALHTCQATQTKVDALEKELLAAKIEAFEAHTAALENLENWPVWKRSIARLRLPDDATIRALRMNIAYYQSIEQDAEKVESPFLPSLHHGTFADSLCDHLLLGERISQITQAREALSQSLYPASRGESLTRINGTKATLRAQRQHLEKLLAEYIAYKQR